MEINLLDIVIHVLNILVLYILLRLLVYKPVRRFMLERENRIQRQLEEAAAVKNEAEEHSAKIRRQLENADLEAQRLLREGSQKASESASAIISAANEQAEKTLESAREQAEEERRRLLTSLEPEVAQIAVDIAGEILKREVSQEDNRRVIETFFEKVG